jgi:HPr kinase/phosphorylase
LIHGTAVALGERCALLRGPPGVGKSDLALRFLFLPPEALGARPFLVADDQVCLRREGGHVIASCPPALLGKIEVRGAGIASTGDGSPETRLVLIAGLDRAASPPRYPDEAEWETLLGVQIRRIYLDPFEPSAPIKLALVLMERFAISGG